ncbi:MAG TPA: NADP-dependent malic enzyme [Firmicutes bacterium]|nr:NADP-dependent malic enzyme [Bacillota bacterium]
MRITKEEALNYHSCGGRPGKIGLSLTKPVVTQRDLSLAYTPGVAEPVWEIAASPEKAYDYTSKGNMVAVVSNGTAVLGIGDVGPLAAKPVMEGKCVLFKRFADIDAFDLEIDAGDPAQVVSIVKAIAPSFGGINLEDIKAPDCFVIEEQLKKELHIPVFHDDQHGTAIIVGAALLNALEIVGKEIGQVQVVINGAGAAGIACANFLLQLGVSADHLLLCDSKGVITKRRLDSLNPYKAKFARDVDVATLAEAVAGADVFIGLSVKGALTPEMVGAMAEKPIVFALANPDPEMAYEDIKALRPEAIVATGRSDKPNQVNNVLGFPFIFRGALDVSARQINEEMKLAAARALAALAREPVTASIAHLYGVDHLSFGPDYIIPKPLDPRVLTRVAPAVARAAMASGVAGKIIDIEEYEVGLQSRLGPTKEIKLNLMTRVKRDKRRVVFSEGENEKVLKAAAVMTKEHIATPILLGREEVIKEKAERLGIRQLPEIIDPNTDKRLKEFARELYLMRQRKGVTRTEASIMVRRPIYFGAMLVTKGEAEALVGGPALHPADVMRPALQVIRPNNGYNIVAGLYITAIAGRIFFLTDPTVNVNPSAEDLAHIALMAEERVRAMGVEPRIAMLSFSSFGSSRHPAAVKMSEAAELVKVLRPEVVCDGEIQAHLAVNHELLDERHPFSDLTDAANILVFPGLEAANIAVRLLQSLGGAEVMGPILLGTERPVYVLRNSDDVSDIIDVTALAVVHIQDIEKQQSQWSTHAAVKAGKTHEVVDEDLLSQLSPLERIFRAKSVLRSKADIEGEFVI